MTKDEPALGADFDSPRPSGEPEKSSSYADRIRSLVESQKYAVLCTQGEGQPYASIVASAFSDDLAQATFVTPIATRKYRLLTQCDQVALFVDNRSEGQDRMMEIEALTVTGRARRLEQGREWQRWSSLLIRRHPQLEAFVASPTSALFRIDLIRYFHVSRFQEVRQWQPAKDGSSL